MESTKKYPFIPCPGFILIDPLEKAEKSSMIHVQDPVDNPHRGTVVAVGAPKITDYGIIQESPVKAGDIVLYSIAGIEETKLEYKGDKRKRFIIAPFSRILLKL